MIADVLLIVFVALSIVAVLICIVGWTVGLIDKIEELRWNRQKRDVKHLLTTAEWEEDGDA